MTDLPQTEEQLQAWVIYEARARNILVSHTPDSRGEVAGRPDLVLVGTGLAFAELKSPKGIVRPEQRTWHNRLVNAGVPCYLWAPGDEEEILAVLDRLAVGLPTLTREEPPDKVLQELQAAGHGDRAARRIRAAMGETT